jgi:hypothetical protein
MRRLFACLALILALAALPAAAGNMDFVVMVDTSTSMFPYFDDLIHYLIQDLLKEKLHPGDSFHLLSFSGAPEEELTTEITSEQDVEKAFGRILLLQPLGRYTDLIAALRFLYRYVRELPETNPKTILLLTDGVHDPPPGSQNGGDAAAVKAAISEIASQIEKQGWGFHILKVPAEPAPGEEGLPSYLTDLAQTLRTSIVPYKTENRGTITGQTTGFPTLKFPDNLGRIGTRFRATFRITNYRAEPIIVRLAAVEAGGSQLLDRAVSVTVPARNEAAMDVPLRLPPGTATGEQTLNVRLRFQDDLRISPTEGDLAFTFTGGAGFSLPRLNFLYILFIVLGVVLAVLLVLLFLFMRRKLNEVSLAGVQKALPGQAAGKAQPVLQRRGRETALSPGAAAGMARGGAASKARAHEPAGNGRQLAAAEPAAPQEPAARAPVGRPFRRARVPLMEAGTAGIPRAPVSAAAAAPARHTVESIRTSLPSPSAESSTLPPQIEMHVSEQNSHIGFRNIHRIPPGSSRSVGGSFSAFFVFIVPVPGRIAEIRNEAGRYVFMPLRPEYFPAVSGPVTDCVGAEIPFTTPKGYSGTISFRKWVSPLEEINALMRSVPKQF